MPKPVTVEAPTGGHTMTLLPPRPDHCQECATKHEPDLPHNAQSLYYGTKFQMEHKRSPTWTDAMAHCTPEMKKIWVEELRAAGVDVKGGKVNPEAGRGKKKG